MEMSKEEINDNLIMLKYFLKEEGDKNWQDYCNAIEGLLDLYNKEKEKNKTLETLLQGNLYQMYSYYKELASRYQANSISKDKIREKIKELEQFQEQHKKGNWRDIPIEDYDFDKINLLKELLGE